MLRVMGLERKNVESLGFKFAEGLAVMGPEQVKPLPLQARFLIPSSSETMPQPSRLLLIFCISLLISSLPLLFHSNIVPLTKTEDEFLELPNPNLLRLFGGRKGGEE